MTNRKRGKRLENGDVNLGRLLIYSGIALIVAGIVVSLLSRLPLPLGRLPGDIEWRGKHTTFYFPVVTCIVLSLLASLILWLVNRR